MQELIEIANAFKSDPTFMAVFTSYVGSVAWDSTKQGFSGVAALLRGNADSIDLESLKGDSSVGNLRALAQRFISEVLEAGDEQNKFIGPGDVQVIEAHVFEYLKAEQCDGNLRQSLEQLARELNIPDVDGFLLAFSITLARTSSEIARLYMIELAESTDCGAPFYLTVTSGFITGLNVR